MQLVVELLYIAYGCLFRGLSLLSNHCYLLLHCCAAGAVVACLLVARSLYRLEEETDQWAAAEEELDATTQRATLSSYQTDQHALQHDKEAVATNKSWI